MFRWAWGDPCSLSGTHRQSLPLSPWGCRCARRGFWSDLHPVVRSGLWGCCSLILLGFCRRLSHSVALSRSMGTMEAFGWLRIFGWTCTLQWIEDLFDWIYARMVSECHFNNDIIFHERSMSQWRYQEFMEDVLILALGGGVFPECMLWICWQAFIPFG